MSSMYRGLSTFISDIRNCKTREQEQQRVDKELANIRKAFVSGTMDTYDQKKYVWKLVYINLLGYDIDFGHMEMIQLISCPTYAEKLVGYMSTSVMLRNTDPQITLVVQAIKTDLESTQDHIQCLALCAISNIGGKQLAEAVSADVSRILFSRSIFPIVRKKAALCLLRLYRISRELLPSEEWGKKLTNLLEDKNIGVVLSVITLILGLAERDPAAYENCTGHLLVWLTRLAVQRQVPDEYIYHSVACPWLQVKILRLLQCFPIPATEAMRTRLNELLTHIMSRTEVTKSFNRNNAEHGILFEAISLIMKQGDLSLPDLRSKAIGHLSRFINIREPNIRYLGLEMMSRMTKMEGTSDAIRKQQQSVYFSLKDADISIRRRALDLLFNMTNSEVAESIVQELLDNLQLADWQFKDELVLKTAILAERYAPNLRWYVDTIMQLVSIAGDHVADDIWHRLVQIVTNNADLQTYAAMKAYNILTPLSAHETAVKAGGYLLGEFGYMLNEASEDVPVAVSGAELFATVHQHFSRVSSPTKCLLLSTYLKFQTLYPEVRTAILSIFEQHTSVLDTELQQRALEYSQFPKMPEELTSVVLEVMPPFPERQSALETKLAQQGESKDRDAWGVTSEEDKNVVNEDDEDVETVAEYSGRRRGGGSSAESEVTVGGSAAAPNPLDDLFGGMSGGSAPTAAVPTKAVNPLDDLFGISAPAPAPVPAPAPAPVPAPAPAPTVSAASVPVTTRIGVNNPAKAQKQFSQLLFKPSGVLYDDEYVQIGCKRAFSGATGTVTLFLGNKTSHHLVSLRVNVVEQAGLKCVIESPVSAVALGAQAQIPLQLSASAPFAEAPQLQISFISAPGTGHAYALKLPVLTSSFCEGVNLAGPDFRTRWSALAGAPKELTAVIPAGESGATVASAAAAVASVGASSVDSGAPGPTGAATFRTTTVNQAGQPVSVGALIMIIPDANANVFKVAVRTQHPDVTKGIMNALNLALTN